MSDNITEDEVDMISARMIADMQAWLINFEANYYTCMPQISLSHGSDY